MKITIDATNTNEWQIEGSTSIGRSVRKGRRYLRRKVRIPYQSLEQCGGVLEPGDWLTYAQNGNGYTARYVGFVTAPADGETVLAFQGLAVLVLGSYGVYERWISREDVTEVLGRRPAPYMELFAMGEL